MICSMKRRVAKNKRQENLPKIHTPRYVFVKKKALAYGFEFIRQGLRLYIKAHGQEVFESVYLQSKSSSVVF